TPWGTPPPRARRLPRLGEGRDGARPQARRRRTPRPVHAGWRPAPRSARRALAPSPARGGRSGWGHGRRRADGGTGGRTAGGRVPARPPYRPLRPAAPAPPPRPPPPPGGEGGGGGNGRRRADGGPEAGSAAAGCPHPSSPPQAGEGANPGKSGAGEERTQGRADTGRTLLRRDPDRAGRRDRRPSPRQHPHARRRQPASRPVGPPGAVVPADG